MNTIRRRTAALALGGVSLAAALTGCATSSGTQAGNAVDSGAAGSASYKNGDYSAKGSYQSPGGTETIDVNVTLANNVITAIKVTPEATDGNAQRYQSQFAGGISAVVVGKNIGSIKVDRVAGSSLTSGGFNDAIATIKADAVS